MGYREMTRIKDRALRLTPFRDQLPACVLLMLVTWLICSTPATAAEPDNDITRANGPIAGGTDYTGGLETQNDIDWYAFDVNSQRQFKVVVSNTGGCPSYEQTGITANFLDKNGEELGSNYTASGGNVTFAYTAPISGPARYYVRLKSDCDPGVTYQLRVDPADAITTSIQNPPERVVGEPNDTISQATGPLVGATLYRGKLETSNDVDRFFFYTPSSPKQIDVSMAVVDKGSEGSMCSWLGLGFNIRGPDYQWDTDYRGSLLVDNNKIGHFTFTSYRAARYDLWTGNCQGAEYAIRVDPAGALTDVPPPRFGVRPPSPSCRTARRALRAADRQLRILRRQFRTHPTHRGLRRLNQARQKRGHMVRRVATLC
jgi:hypothetical protein